MQIVNIDFKMRDTLIIENVTDVIHRDDLILVTTETEGVRRNIYFPLKAIEILEHIICTSVT